MSDEKLEINDQKETYGVVLYKEVNREMGCGFLESVYQECLEQDFAFRGIPFQSHLQLSIKYKDRVLNQYYVTDFVCYEKIIVEIKAIQETANEHRAQLLNYLKATGMKLGFLVNFGHYPKASIERIVN